MPIGRRCWRSASSWRSWHLSRSSDVVRGEVFRLPAPRAARGREQRGARYAVIVQADELLGLSTVLVSPTSTRAQPASFRPAISLEGTVTRVLVEQTAVVDPERLGKSAGHPSDAVADERHRARDGRVIDVGDERGDVRG
jgi:mRNA interferase MazF